MDNFNFGFGENKILSISYCETKISRKYGDFREIGKTNFRENPTVVPLYTRVRRLHIPVPVPIPLSNRTFPTLLTLVSGLLSFLSAQVLVECWCELSFSWRKDRIWIPVPTVPTVLLPLPLWCNSKAEYGTYLLIDPFESGNMYLQFRYLPGGVLR